MTDDSWLFILSAFPILRFYSPTKVWISMIKMAMSYSDWIISLQYVPMTSDKNADKCFHFQANTIVVDFIFWISLWCVFYKLTNSIHQANSYSTNHLWKVPLTNTITFGIGIYIRILGLHKYSVHNNPFGSLNAKSW